LRARIHKPKNRLYDAYSRSEFQRIRSAAAQIVRTAQHRIDSNMSILKAYSSGEEADDAPTVRFQGKPWTIGAALDHLATMGSFPTPLIDHSDRLRRLVNTDGTVTTNEALFPNSAEALSICILLVCERGYNCSVLDRLTVDIDRADDYLDDEPIHLLHIDKPRRGPQSRYSDESVTGEASRTISRAIVLTRQARQTRALLGEPTNSLFLYRTSRPLGRNGAALFKTTIPNDHHVVQGWLDRTQLLADDGSPLRLNLQRLRLTEQVLNKRPRQNSPAVSESVYRQPDPQTRKEAATVIIRGQTEAIEHARVTVAMRTVTDREFEDARIDPTHLAQRLGVEPEKVRMLLSGALNTATGACLDFNSSPYASHSGQSCPASFLTCLGCSNAVATPGHLPRLVALSDALERIGSAVSREVWLEDYANHYARLVDLLTSNATPEQRDHTRQQISSTDVAVIDRLLTRGFDA
jgi:hypothetical protein